MDEANNSGRVPTRRTTIVHLAIFLALLLGGAFLIASAPDQVVSGYTIEAVETEPTEDVTAFASLSPEMQEAVRAELEGDTSIIFERVPELNGAVIVYQDTYYEVLVSSYDGSHTRMYQYLAAGAALVLAAFVQVMVLAVRELRRRRPRPSRR